MHVRTLKIHRQWLPGMYVTYEELGYDVGTS